MKKIKGLTESQVLASIHRIADQLAPSQAFGHYGIDDIKQECFAIALERIHKFDPGRSNNEGATLEEKLDQFFYTTLSRRLYNLKRNKFCRLEHPCAACAANDHCEPGGCKPHQEWLRRNSTKMNLMSPSHFQADAPVYVKEPDACTNAAVSEALRLIDERLDVEMREDYLKMRAGVHVAAPRRAEVEEAVKAILGGDL